MRVVIRAALAAIVGVAAAAGGALEAAPPSARTPASGAPGAGAPAGPEIVVTGRRGQQEQQVTDFVAALTASPDGAIPRFVDQVCPAAAGLLPEQNEAVA